jgi:hypothetical protein
MKCGIDNLLLKVVKLILVYHSNITGALYDVQINIYTFPQKQNIFMCDG